MEMPKERLLLGSPVLVGMVRFAFHPTTHQWICTPGKSTFLFFMLARLFSVQQVVLLSDGLDIYLFYRGKVYCRPAELGFSFENLPENPNRKYSPIPALTGADSEAQSPFLDRFANVWPIQVSLKPDQWKHWVKQYNAAVLGMPLWSTGELMKGYVFS